jgi:cell wall-associated NlpC family hydrolase
MDRVPAALALASADRPPAARAAESADRLPSARAPEWADRLSAMPRSASAHRLPALRPPTLADRPPAAELDRRIGAAARRLEVIVEQYNEAREDLTATLTRQRALGARLGPMTADLRERQNLVAGLVARTYQRTRSGPTIALFGSDDPHQFVDRLLVLNQLAVEQQRATADLSAARTRVDDTRRALDLLAAQQRRQQTQLRTRKAMVQGEIAVLKQMRTAAYGGGSRYSDTGHHATSPYVPGPAGRVVAFAFAQLGKPYRWGAEGPDAYDCSGLTLAAWRTAGVHLPHNAARQYAATAHLSSAQLRPGDLVFFYGRISHVGLYIGDGRMIHAPEFGEDVRVSAIDSQPIHGFGRPTSS